MASNSLFDITKLLQKPKKWTSRHLEGLNIQEHHHLPAAAIIGAARLPADNDPLFVELARHLTEPTRHEILTGIWLPDNMFGVSFGTLLSAVTTLEKGQAPYAEMLAFADKFLQTICRRDKLIDRTYSSFPFHLPSLNVKGSLKTDYTYFTRTHQGSILPLTIFLAGKGPDPLSITHEVVPYLLAQVILGYEQNPDLENYAAFVVGMKGTIIQFVKGDFAKSYIQDLTNRRNPNSSLQLGFSQPYDLLEQEDRRELVRVFIGLFQCLYDLMDVYHC